MYNQIIFNKQVLRTSLLFYYDKYLEKIWTNILHLTLLILSIIVIFYLMNKWIFLSLLFIYLRYE